MDATYRTRFERAIEFAAERAEYPVTDIPSGAALTWIFDLASPRSNCVPPLIMSGGNPAYQRGSVPATVSAAMGGDNPYLQHKQPNQRGAGPSTSKSGAGPAKEPLYGFLPRKVGYAQVTKAMVCHVALYNPDHYSLSRFST